MFLLLVKSKSVEGARLFTDWDDACARAREWVGAHNPVDGCSSEPREFTKGQRFRVERQTSFGRRAATANVVSPVVIGDISLP